MMFCGKNYYGMQYQTEFPTIEFEIFKALVKVGLVTQRHVDNKNEQVQKMRCKKKLFNDIIIACSLAGNGLHEPTKAFLLLEWFQ